MRWRNRLVPGEALVKFKPSVSQEARIDAILKESGTEPIAEIKGIGVHHVRIVGKESVESVVRNSPPSRKLNMPSQISDSGPNKWLRNSFRKGAWMKVLVVALLVFSLRLFGLDQRQDG